jgi:methyl-accepting chemotaxis protein
MSEQLRTPASLPELTAVYEALDRVQGIIEFELDGTIIAANENFLAIVGYEAGEIAGNHHRLLCDPEYAASPEYKEFWRRLGEGHAAEAEFKRLTKRGDEVWLRASYNPVVGNDGKPKKVVKFATDVTEAKLQAAEFEGISNAINRAQAVIEFELDGTVIDANENFLEIFGYTLEEIVGKKHRMFCDPMYAESTAYGDLWRTLGQGNFKSGEFRRMHKNGSEIWLQASYNPNP